MGFVCHLHRKYSYNQYINNETDKVGQMFSALNSTYKTNKSQSSNNLACQLGFSKTVENSLEKGIMKFLIININLSHLWSNLQNNITFIIQFHHINRSTCLTITQERWKQLKQPWQCFTFSLIFAFMVFWSSCNEQNQTILFW